MIQGTRFNVLKIYQFAINIVYQFMHAPIDSH